MESKEYLLSISRKVQAYADTKEAVIRYIKKNIITDINLQTNLMVIGAIWTAGRLNEDLTEDMLLSIFGLAATNESALPHKFLELDEDHKHLTLKELLDSTIENF
jgi:hypothetical protein